MGGSSLPPGFRFHPTDEELIGYYLKRKTESLEIELEVVPVIDLYKFDPWELPAKRRSRSFQNQTWNGFFLCQRDRKHPNGSRTNRATKSGYWKATGKDRKVVCDSSVTGYRKTLVFYRGRAPSGNRTDWVMHEYRLSDDPRASTNQGAFALCRIMKRNEQKVSDANGEPKVIRVGIMSSDMELKISNESLSHSGDISCQLSYPNSESRYSSPITWSPHEVTQVPPFELVSLDIDQASLWLSHDLILDSSKAYPQICETAAEYFPQYEFPSSLTPFQQYEHTDFSSSSMYSNFGETEHVYDLSRIRQVTVLESCTLHGLL